MLPFLKARKAATTIIERRKATGETAPTEQSKEADMHPVLLEASEHLIHGIQDKDSARVAKGLSMAHEHLSSSPDESDEA